jgi:hypothetical protein
MSELLIVHLPGDIEPIERGNRFEDPLDSALRKRGKLGRCVGGGTAFSLEAGVTGCDIEIEVTDLGKAMPVIRDSLQTARAPIGATVKHAETDQVLLRFTKRGVKEAAFRKKAKKRFVDSCPWQVGEVLTFRITPKRHVLLHVYGFGGLGPLFWVPEWCGAEIPEADEIRRLIRMKPEYYRLGSVYEAWRMAETDRDDRKLVTTGVVVTPPANGLRGWSPGVVEVRPWKKFERTLKEVFGLVSTTAAVRLNHDLGLLTSVAHLGVWHSRGSVAAPLAKRLFYGHGSGFRRSHPDRVRQPVTDELRLFVKELKSQFNGDTFNGDFSANEGFVIIPVNRRRFRAVWVAAERLARRHRLACYDPEADHVSGSPSAAGPRSKRKS